MKRLTVHLGNVQKVYHNGKEKIFNTLSFEVRNDRDVTNIISGLSNVKKHYTSNIL